MTNYLTNNNLRGNNGNQKLYYKKRSYRIIFSEVYCFNWFNPDFLSDIPVLYSTNLFWNDTISYVGVYIFHNH